MTIVNLSKARAYAASIDSETSRDWITELADEVESLKRVLDASRATTQAALAEGVALAADLEQARKERDQLFTALTGLYGSITELLTGIGKVAP